MSKPRTLKRSSSRAHTACPYCEKRLSGAKGVEAHIAAQHADKPAGSNVASEAARAGASAQ